MSAPFTTFARCLGLAVLVASATLASAHEYEAGTISVAHPWVRTTPPGATVGVAFAEIKAAAGGGDTLVSASSPVAGRVEVHSMTEEDGIMKMRRLEKLGIEAGTSHVLSPSANHIMLVDLKQPLKEGELVKITLVFEKAGPITIDASVEPLGAKGPHGMDHQPGHEPAGGDKAGHQHDHH